MENHPAVAVGAPDELGLRKVSAGGKTLGAVRSAAELQRLLRHHGLAFETDVQWCGGDSTVWPDRPWPRRIAGVLMAAGLLATAVLLVKVGMADATGALSYAGRLAGATFIAAGIVEFIGVFAAADYWTRRQSRFSGGILLITAAISLVVNVVLLFVQIAGRTYTPYLWVWITLIVWSVWALHVLVRARAWKGLRNPKRVAMGALLSGVLAGTNLLYTQVYVPHVAAPLVESTAVFQPTSLGKDGTRLYVPVHFTVRNDGGVPVYVLGSIYWIKGVPRNADRAKQPYIDQCTASGKAKPKSLPKFTLLVSHEFIAPPGRALTPGEEFSGDTVVTIDRKHWSCYETVTVQTEMYMVRQDRTKIDPGYELSRMYRDRLSPAQQVDPEGPPGDYFRYQGEVSNSNEILNATRGRQRVTMWWMYSGANPYVYVHVGPPGEKAKAFDPDHPNANQEKAERYGLARVRGSMAEKPLAELLNKADDGGRNE
ncbi:hypothetical protein LG634_22970 [Streptomyces bambusae]|uniref:hypothetical protein n=1 Tax=Streptomyces bambusae TaxID=1550616 RepID=UPI001CFEA2A8|nr:hypothetical protein [Streptomyces bambusae]MCB5167680.1 hypothetical protein [Streptomyces bambusae]